MAQPTDSSGVPTRPGCACKLLKSNYGLRQPGIKWGQAIHTKLVEWEFQQSNQDPRLYFYKGGPSFMDLILVVDDIAFASNDRQPVAWFKPPLQDTLNQCQMAWILQRFHLLVN